MEGDDPQHAGFTPEVLDRTVIALPLLKDMERAPNDVFPVIIDVNLGYTGDDGARAHATALIERAITERGTAGVSQGVNTAKSELSDQYLFARLEGAVIRQLVVMDDDTSETDSDDPVTEAPAGRSIHRIWPDFPVRALTTKSIRTVKADAARISFSAVGSDVVWAVVDSGIQGDHPHFAKWKNLDVSLPVRHRDFTDNSEQPLVDEYGHGTHVAGILAGEQTADARSAIRAVARHRDERGAVTYHTVKFEAISGMAPRCGLVSMKVLDGNGNGEASSVIAALEQIQRINGNGRHIRIHGFNLSVGYDFDPEWFACGQSPLCIEVDRLVRAGVVVVVAAGNTGYAYQQTLARGAVASAQDLSINDPGNAELAITVGSTHRDQPHIYGVSYFSSKGPTGDGRAKPDLVAPGEKILSCAAGKKRAAVTKDAETFDYVEDSGTSMAAPHVSGVIAAFLSVRSEFIGRPERVKEVFLSSATDLKRDRNFQGAGLVDLMRAIQSV